MTKIVLDSSAVLTLYYDEPGKKRVRTLLDRFDPLISAVNLCEVFSKLIEDGLDSGDIWDSFQALEIEVVDLDFRQALKVAELRPVTKKLGLSLGDRACVALAMHANAIAVTADRNWAKLKVCKIEVIR